MSASLSCIFRNCLLSGKKESQGTLSWLSLCGEMCPCLGKTHFKGRCQTREQPMKTGRMRSLESLYLKISWAKPCRRENVGQGHMMVQRWGMKWGWTVEEGPPCCLLWGSIARAWKPRSWASLVYVHIPVYPFTRCCPWVIYFTSVSFVLSIKWGQPYFPHCIEMRIETTHRKPLAWCPARSKIPFSVGCQHCW